MPAIAGVLFDLGGVVMASPLAAIARYERDHGLPDQAITRARELELRAVSAQTPANNFPACQLLLRCAFELAGLDTKRHSNHDIVKEAATLIWYAALD